MHNRRLLKIACIVLAFALLPLSGASAHMKAPNYTEQYLHSFCKSPDCFDGAHPSSGVIMDAGGNLYGTTPEGGKHGDGLVYKLTPNADHSKYTEAVLYPFGQGGAFPQGDLIMDIDGNLYGVTSGGGYVGRGVVFKLAHSGDKWTYSTLYKFCQSDCSDGRIPMTGLTYQGQASGALWDKSSPLFGTTSLGGQVDGDGAVFKLVNNGGVWTETVIHAFTASQKANALTMDAAGNIYGTTKEGGKYGGGLMYMLEHGTWTQTVFKAFCALNNCSDGGHPLGRLLVDASGNIFGTTYDGGSDSEGVVFERTAGGTYKKLYDFKSGIRSPFPSENPAAGLIMDNSGNLFGTTLAGGVQNSNYCTTDNYTCGTVFELSKNGDGTWSETPIHRFFKKSSDGFEPDAPLILDQAGNLFGTTKYGGKNEYYGGMVFELKP
jgi:uncharacterized repeat protein (TIGR03803 family)